MSEHSSSTGPTGVGGVGGREGWGVGVVVPEAEAMPLVSLMGRGGSGSLRKKNLLSRTALRA